jgi:uncharacterized GH25 family protein
MGGWFMKLRIVVVLALALAFAGACCAGETVSAKGKVVDVDGKPVSGIKVYAVMWRHETKNGWNHIGSYVKAATLTNADGSYDFRSLPKHTGKGTYYLVAFDPDKYLGWVHGEGTLCADGWWDDPEPVDGYTIVAVKLGVYHGKVVDEQGNGIAGATVVPTQLLLKSSGTGMRVEHLASVVKIKSALTDASGNFSITGVPDGIKIGPSVSAPGYAYVDSYDFEEPTVVLRAGGDITGRLLDSHGRGVAGVGIWASCTDKNAYSYRQAQTGKDGTYTVQGLQVGTYRVSASPDNEIVDPVTDIKVTAGQKTKAPDLKIQPGVFVTGRILDSKSGKPVSGATVYVLGNGDINPTWYSRGEPADDKGFYKVKSLPGKASIRYSGGNDFYAAADKPKEITVSQTGLSGVDLKLKRYRELKCKVVDQNGKPVINAMVRDYGRGTRLTTDIDGNFRIAVMSEGRAGGG